MEPVPELNVIRKDWRKVALRVALCYPNVYRAGMSGLTIRLLYALFNVREEVLCERFFIPTFAEPPKSLESNHSLRDFDVVAFSLQYEEDYPNVIRLLLESGIPPRRKQRKPEDPVLIAGGPCATANPEPLADYVDLFVIGEAEPLIDQLIENLLSRDQNHLDEFANVKGVYVPEVLNPTERVLVRNLDDAPHPLAQQVPLVDPGSPYMTVFGRAFAAEFVRGCNRFCRFCLVSQINRPKRERSLEKIEGIIDEGIHYTPVKKVSVIGASIFDYSHLEDACDFIVSRELEIAIPSIRPECVTERLAGLLAKGKQRSVSLAPDGTSPRMRDIANKRMDEKDVLDAAKTLLLKGVNRLKLYFVVGIPGETLEDIKAVAELSKQIADAGYRSKSIHININPLIPKPHTPFQWVGSPSVSYVRGSINVLKKQLKGDSRFVISCLDPRRAQIQALLSLGDRKIGGVIESVARRGGGLGAWRRALKECDVSLTSYIGEKGVEDRLPWDRIDVGSRKQRLLDEFNHCKQWA